MMSTCACCGKAGHEKARCRFRNGKTGHLRAVCRQREKSAGKSSPSSSSGKSVLAKVARTVENRDKCYCCGQVCHTTTWLPSSKRELQSLWRTWTLSQVCRSSGGNANARAVEVEPAEPEEEREIQHVWALSVCDISGLPLDALSVCDNSDLPSDESGDLLNMFMDSGAEEHVVSLADWKSLGKKVLKHVRSATGDDMGVSGSFMVRGWCDNQEVELTTRATRSVCHATKLVNAVYSTEMRPAQSVLRRSGGGCMLLQRCGKRDFLSIRLRKSCEINAVTFSTRKREVQSLKSELRVLRTGHLSTSEVRLPWTPEEKLRHESNGHAEYDNRCEICMKSSGISRHPRRVYSESCAFDYASVTFKEFDGYVTVFTGRGPRCECFCRVVPRKGQRLKDLEHFLAVMRAKYPCLQVRSDNEEALRHVLKDACEQVHLEVNIVFEPRKKWYSVRKMQSSRWVLSFPSNILFSRCRCDMVSGS